MRKSLKEESRLKEERHTTKVRPRIAKHRLQMKPRFPFHQRGAVLSGLLDEAEFGSSTIKLYAMLCGYAILEEANDQLVKRYGPRFKRLSRSPKSERI